MNAAEKIRHTVVQMRSPSDDAEGPELALSALVQGLSQPAVAQWLQEREQADELDPFLVALAEWVLSHTSDSKPVQLVIGVPRHGELPRGVVLAKVDRALEAATSGKGSPLGALLGGEATHENLQEGVAETSESVQQLHTPGAPPQGAHYDDA